MNNNINSGQAELEELINDPDPSRLISGLRDTGYTFNSAAADIIDNSIAAKATIIKIEILLHTDGRKQVFFGDNGCGMEPGMLKDAMRYGAPRRASMKSLGKFGLGLKTASSSICKKYSIISRVRKSTELAKLAWDLDHVSKVNKWEMVKEPVSEDEKRLFDELCGASGTLVVWSKCDKLLGRFFEEAGGAKEQNAVKKKRDALSLHAGMVFHKFLDQKCDTYPNISISINGKAVQPWDPFYTEKSQQMLEESQCVVSVESDDGATSEATLKAWILPHSKDLDSNENAKALITSRDQGFYIYREGRMISNAGWLGLFRSDDPHYSLLRAEFCFNHELDHAFQVDVKKSRIIFDPALADELKVRLTGPMREADRRYRRKEQEIVTGTNIPHSSTNISIENVKDRTKKPLVNSANAGTNEATLTNAVGIVKIKTRVQNNISPESLYVEAVTDITSGHLWEPVLRSVGTSNYSTGVRLNKHHDFYSKIYLRAALNGQAVEGIDFLLWAIATAEYNHNSPELRAMFEDLREEVSSNLKKLLDGVTLPDERDLAGLNEIKS